MKFISLLNPYSIKYLWNNNDGRLFLNNYINWVLNSNDKFRLLDYYNSSLNSVRSYSIFESNSKIVLVDFNINNRSLVDDLAIIKILKATNNKEINAIILNDFHGNNYSLDNIYYIFTDDSYFFKKSFNEQYKDNSNITDYLYTMPEDIFKLYNHEKRLLEIDK